MPDLGFGHDRDAERHVQVTTPVQGVLEIRLSRPRKRNALSLETLRQLEHALDLPQNTRVVVLSAEGPVFSAGVDISELHGDERDLEIDAAVHCVAAKIGSLSVPTIAAIDRECIGAANELLLACDGWVLARGAHLKLPAIRMGLLYEPDSISKLQRRLGAAVVNKLVLLQQPIAAEEIGGAILVDDGDETARARSLDIAAELAGQPHDLVACYKRMLNSLAAGDDTRRWGDLHRESFSSSNRSAAITRAQQGSPSAAPPSTKGTTP